MTFNFTYVLFECGVALVFYGTLTTVVVVLFLKLHVKMLIVTNFDVSSMVLHASTAQDLPFPKFLNSHNTQSNKIHCVVSRYFKISRTLLHVSILYGIIIIRESH